jgi:hypothetical protein
VLKFIGLGSVIVGSIATLAGAADPSSVKIVSTDPTQGSGVQIITRDVVEPAATVSRELSEQPVRPYLTEVKVVTQIIQLDPAADYERQDNAEGRLDENHWILRAQRLARSLSNPGVTVIHGNGPRPLREPGSVQPAMIFIKPPNMKQDLPKQIEMPVTPEAPGTPEQTAPAKVARAE